MPLHDAVWINCKNGATTENQGSEPCPIGVYFNFARHTSKLYRKMGSPIGHVWWLTNDQTINFASRTGKI